MRYRRPLGVVFSARALHITDQGRTGDAGAALEPILLAPDDSESQRMLTRYVAEQGLAGIPAIIGLPADLVYLSLLKPPAAPRGAREQAVREHLDGLHALSGSETVSDTADVPAHGPWKPVLVGVARLDAIHAHIAPLQAAGLTIEAAVPLSLALFNQAAQRLARRQDRLVIVCPIGDASVEVLAGTPETLLGVWRVPVNPADAAAPNPSLRNLAAELEQLWRDHPVSRDANRLTVLWTGETPLPPAAATQLSDAIGSPPVSLSHASTHAAAPPPMTATQALAMNTLGRFRIHLDLLPPALRDAVMHRTLRPYHTVAALAFAGFALTLSIAEVRRHADIRGRLDRAERQWQEHLALQERHQVLNAGNATLQRQVRALRDSVLSPLLIRDLLSAIAQAKHPDDWIVRIADAKSYFAAPPGTLSKPPENEASAPFDFTSPNFIVEGYTPGADLASVRSFIEILRLHPQVVAVDLIGDDRVVPDRTPELFRFIPRITRFILEVSIREP